MEHELCEAAIKGDTDSLDAIIQKDPLILHKFADGCFNGAASPLHVATSNNQTHFVEELLHHQPELTEVLDSQLRSALHLASAKGHDEIVKVLVKANSETCLVRDREGKNPLHVAAVKGKINALKELVGACPQAARERVARNETILHLCVRHDQWKSLNILLETIQGEELVNAKDNDGNTILHLAILDRRLEAGLPKKSSPTEVLDSQQRSALHMASAKGHDQIVKELVKANPKMCLVRDRDGKNPVHVAAMEGKTSVLEELVRASPQAARVKVDQNETILHLCVKHNQLESLKQLLKMIKGCDFVNAKDSAGNTILHIAILYEHFQIARHVLGMETKDDQNATNGCGTITRKSLQKIAHVLGMGTNEEKETVDVNATNASGHTAMDVLLSLGSGYKEESDRGHDFDRVHDLLLKANAKQAKDLVGGDWLTNKRESLMVVASLIATMAFQAGVSPPGGVWQDDSKETNGTKAGYKAGEAVMAFNDKGSYLFFLRSNTIGFVASLSTILLLMSGLKFRNKAAMWILIVTMWLAITSMAITYMISNIVVTPSKVNDRKSLNKNITIGVIVWSSVMALLLVKHTFGLVAFFGDKSRKMKANKSINKFEAPSSRGGKGRGANPPLPLTS